MLLYAELYQDSLLKALCGNCVLSMALNTFRNKLRFTNHLNSQLVKLYLCATFNAFIYAGRPACLALHNALAKSPDFGTCCPSFLTGLPLLLLPVVQQASSALLCMMSGRSGTGIHRGRPPC